MAEIIYTPEYLELMESYEDRFGSEFNGICYDTDDGIEIMRECLRTGKAYDISKDPNFDPEAEY